MANELAQKVDPTKVNIEDLNMSILNQYAQKETSSEFTLVPYYDSEGNLKHRNLPIKHGLMELGASDPLFMALTFGGSAGREGLKQGFNLLDDIATKVGNSKFATNAMSWLNKLTPGTKEFMRVWNAGKAGKVAGTGVVGLNAKWMHDAYKAAAADPSAENIAMATMTSLPFMNGFGNMTGKGLDLISKASKPFRDFRLAMNMRAPQLLDDAGRATHKVLNSITQPVKKAYKWLNADKRSKNVQQKASDLYNQRWELEADLENQLGDLGNAIFNQLAKINEIGQELQNLHPHNVAKHPVFGGFMSYDELLKKFKRDAYSKYWFDSFDSHRRIRNRALFQGTTSRPGYSAVDLSKLSDDDLLRLLAKNRLLDKNAVPLLLDELNTRGITFERSADGTGVFRHQDVVFPNSVLYEPSNFVSTEYKLFDFGNAAAEPLVGKILFGGGTGGAKTYTPILNPRTGQVTEIPVLPEGVIPNYLLYFDDEYIKLLAKNIEQVRKDIPGFIPYGSSTAVTKAGFPHATDDIDGYISEAAWKAWRKAHPEAEISETIPGDTYRIEKMYPHAGKEAGGIDVNIIKSGKDGSVEGLRGEQLARMFFPDKYTEWIKSKKTIPLGVTADDILRLADEKLAAKTIADLFEIHPIGKKSKLTGRAFVHLSSSDPEIVREGMWMHANAFGATQGFPISLSELTDVELNIQLLKTLDIPVSIEEVAKSPQRMKNALDYWYLQKTMRSRGVGPKDIPEHKFTTQMMVDAMSQSWNPAKNKGGTANGMGRNTVAGGTSGFGPYQGHWQIKMDGAQLEKLPILERITAIHRTVGDASYTFTPQEQSLILAIAKKHHLSLDPNKLNNSEQLLQQLEKPSKEGAEFLKSFNEEMGIQALTKTQEDNMWSYTGPYSSMTGSTPVEDIRFVMTDDVRPVSMDWRKARMQGGMSSVTQKGQEAKAQVELYELRNLLQLLSHKLHGDSRREELSKRLIDIGSTRSDYAVKLILKNGLWDQYLQRWNELSELATQNQRHMSELKTQAAHTRKKLENVGSDKAWEKMRALNNRYGNIASEIRYRKKMATAISLPPIFATATGFGVIKTADYFSDRKRNKMLEKISNMSNEELKSLYNMLNKEPNKNNTERIYYRYLWEEVSRRGINKLKQGGKVNYLNCFK